MCDGLFVINYFGCYFYNDLAKQHLSLGCKLAEMCSCSTKGRASLVIEVEAEATSKCTVSQLSHFITIYFFIAGAELMIFYKLYYFTKKTTTKTTTQLSHHKNTLLYIV